MYTFAYSVSDMLCIYGVQVNVRALAVEKQRMRHTLYFKTAHSRICNGADANQDRSKVREHETHDGINMYVYCVAL